jgi:hypothetical protein
VVRLIVPAPRRQRQEEQEFEASLGCKERPCLNNNNNNKAKQAGTCTREKYMTPKDQSDTNTE